MHSFDDAASAMMCPTEIRAQVIRLAGYRLGLFTLPYGV
jgi:hypothetical protein